MEPMNHFETNDIPTTSSSRTDTEHSTSSNDDIIVTTVDEILNLDCYNGTGSLPTVDEIKVQNGIRSSTSKSQRKNVNNSVFGVIDDNESEQHQHQQQSKSKWYCCYYTTCRCSLPNILIGILIVVAMMLVLIGIGQGVRYVRTQNNSAARKTNIHSVMEYFTTEYNIQFNSNDTMAATSSTTPQYRAAQWIAEVDEANWGLPKPTTDDNDNNDEQSLYKYRYLARFVMAINYYAFNGHDWMNQLQFLSKYDICQWFGYVQSNNNNNGNAQKKKSTSVRERLKDESDSIQNDILLSGVFCDSQTNIPIDMSIFFNNLAGTIPTENGLLTTLQVLDIKNNLNIHGTIPTELCQLHELKSLFLGYNNLHGTIPHCIGTSLTNLLRIFWSNNQFHNVLPASMSSLTNLQRLLIDNNNFTGNPVKIINNMNQLEMIMIDQNQFTGTINEDFLSNHVNLTILDISNNQFVVDTKMNNHMSVSEGIEESVPYLPKHLFEMKQLRVLDISRNNFTAMFPVPFDIVENVAMEVLNVYGNAMKGTIPTTLSKLQALEYLDLSHNQFIGTIPDSISTIANLTYIYVNDNIQLDDGPIPEWIFPTSTTSDSSSNNMNQSLLVKEVSLRNTNRNGTIPPSSTATSTLSMPNLVLLDLSYNALTGTIPETWGSSSGSSMPQLEFLVLSNNNGLNGSIPTSFLNAVPNLRVLLIDGTNIYGSFDDTICTVPAFLSNATTTTTNGKSDTNDEEEISGGMIYVNCNKESQSVPPQFQCSCCTCCETTTTSSSSSNSNTNECLHTYLIANVDTSWEHDFKRSYYQFVDSNDTSSVLYYQYNT